MSYSSNLLIASPALADPNFRQSVVLILSGNDEETFGVILNRQSEKHIAEIWDQVFETPCRTKQLIHLGGPVFGPLIALHTSKDLADAEVFPGLYFSTQKESLEAVVDEKQPFRLYVGGAGWGKKQLKMEIQQGAWYLIPATIGDVFDDPTEIWKKTLDRAGRRMLSSILHQKKLPEDPTLN